MNIKIQIDRNAFIPDRAHPADAGIDLHSPVDVLVEPGKSVIINTGVHIEIPYGYVGFLKSRSGLNVKHGLVSEGVIDSGYTGAIAVKLYNHGDEPYYLMRGHKITQLVILPCVLADFEIVDELEETTRGDNGFGSTGK